MNIILKKELKFCGLELTKLQKSILCICYDKFKPIQQTLIGKVAYNYKSCSNCQRCINNCAFTNSCFQMIHTHEGIKLDILLGVGEGNPLRDKLKEIFEKGLM